jgi:hypothetical protein
MQINAYLSAYVEKLAVVSIWVLHSIILRGLSLIVVIVPVVLLLR